MTFKSIILGGSNKTWKNSVTKLRDRTLWQSKSVGLSAQGHSVLPSVVILCLFIFFSTVGQCMTDFDGRMSQSLQYHGVWSNVTEFGHGVLSDFILGPFLYQIKKFIIIVFEIVFSYFQWLPSSNLQFSNWKVQPQVSTWPQVPPEIQSPSKQQKMIHHRNGNFLVFLHFNKSVLKKCIINAFKNMKVGHNKVTNHTKTIYLKIISNYNLMFRCF